MNKEEQVTLSRWVKATFWGWLLGVILILILSSILDSMGIEHVQFYLGVGMGAGVGFAQRLMLKKFMDISQNWIWFSITGMGIPFIVIDLLPAGTLSNKLPLSIVLGALTVGFLQGTLLKSHSRNSFLWIPGCFLGWTLGVTTVFTIDYTNHLKSLISSNLALASLNLFLILAGGIVLGVIQGITFKRMLP